MNSFILKWMEKFGIPTKGMGFDFIKNTSWVTIATILANVMSYFLIILLTRFLGAKGLGQYSFVFAFSMFFFILSDWGLNLMMVKDLSRNSKKIDVYVSNIVSFKSLSLFASFMMFVVSLFFINKNSLFLTLIVAGLVQVSFIFSGLGMSILRVKNKGAPIAYGIFFERLFSLIVGGALLYIYHSLFLFVIALLFSQILRMLIYYFSSKKYFHYKFTLNWKFLFNLIKKGYPFMLVGVFGLVYAKMDTIMLSFMSSDLITGYYNAGYKLIETLSVITTLLLMFGFPMFSKLYKENKKALKLLLEKILHYALVLILPIVVGVIFLSSRIINFIYGFSSVEATLAFKILIVAQIFVFLANIIGFFIAAVDKQKVFAKIAGLGALMNIILNFILIPKYSLYGAAVATVITYIFMFIWMYLYAQKNVLKFNLFRKSLSPLLASIFLFFVMPYLLSFNLFIIISLSVIIYFAVFLLLMALSRMIALQSK